MSVCIPAHIFMLRKVLLEYMPIFSVSIPMVLVIESLVTDIHMVIHAPLVLKRKVFGSTSLVPLTLEVR